MYNYNFIHHHHNHPEGVVYRSLCLDSSTAAVSETVSRWRWWWWWWWCKIVLPIQGKINSASQQQWFTRNADVVQHWDQAQQPKSFISLSLSIYIYI